VAGTQVLMADGTRKAIEDVKVGDKVTGRNIATGKDETHAVTRTFIHHDMPTYDVVVEGHRVTTTEDHPFYVHGKGWTSVKDLQAGDRLDQPDGTTVAVQDVVTSGRTATVYNFEVQTSHDYYVQVGAHWVLVHNTCDLDIEGLAHVVARHTAGGGERDAMAGVFDNGVDLASLARVSAGQIGTRNAATGNIEYVVRSKDLIGVTGGSNGLPTSTYTIVRNSYGELVTMFPGG
jgi:Pretoxin HINT domain